MSVDEITQDQLAEKALNWWSAVQNGQLDEADDRASNLLSLTRQWKQKEMKNR